MYLHARIYLYDFSESRTTTSQMVMHELFLSSKIQSHRHSSPTSHDPSLYFKSKVEISNLKVFMCSKCILSILYVANTGRYDSFHTSVLGIEPWTSSWFAMIYQLRHWDALNTCVLLKHDRWYKRNKRREVSRTLKESLCDDGRKSAHQMPAGIDQQRLKAITQIVEQEQTCQIMQQGKAWNMR